MAILTLWKHVLLLIDGHSTTEGHESAIIRGILEPESLSRLIACFDSTNRSLIISALNLWTVLASYRRGLFKKSVLDAFPWDHPVRDLLQSTVPQLNTL